ncbi:monooxygenase 2-like [Andrographis paniculata]|uniref:monooxygenase 2-like n=1 Tax=Andrographis paniculata TaxID=175694 RepID=UPI0021E8B95B|nr:monooxygenase 2-like [Andrographis paniculata]
MERVEEDAAVVIVGAGIAGLSTSLALHRLGVESVVLERADSLRAAGFGIGLWNNAWIPLDALGIAQSLRHKHPPLTGLVTLSIASGLTTSDKPYTAIHHKGGLESRCVNRKVLLETLENQLPKGTIRYSSKVVRIQEEQEQETTHGRHACTLKSIHLSDGTILKAKVLIGCDGVNSMVAKYLGFNKPSSVGRWVARGIAYYENGHGFEPKSLHFFGEGVKYGIVPCDHNSLYWFFAYIPSPQEQGIEENPAKLKQFILSNLGKVSDRIIKVFQGTHLTNIVCSEIRTRHPWELLWGNISKGNVCVAGDALHPMTPEMGQGACAALESSIVLARALAGAMKERTLGDDSLENELQRIHKGLEKYADERRWRSINLITASWIFGQMQKGNGAVISFLRGKIMAKFLARLMLKMASFDCGPLQA